MPVRLQDEDIGGAVVNQTFSWKGEYLKRNRHLTREEVLSMANRHELSEIGYIDFQRKSSPPAHEPRERFIIMTGKNEYGVIEGRKINDEPLSKQDADRLAQQS